MQPTTQNQPRPENAEQTPAQTPTKSGFINLIGRTNSGKSSLLNYILGEKIAFVSHKQNATRRKIAGIAMFEGHQLIFVDTPGLNKSERVMNKLMNEAALKAVGDCDALVFCASVFDALDDYREFLTLAAPAPHIVALTKTDLATREQLFAKIAEYAAFAGHFAALVPISVKKPPFRAELLREICKLLPAHPHFFDPEDLSTATTKDIIRDFLLEAVFECVSEEVPYYTDAKVLRVEEGVEFGGGFAGAKMAKNARRGGGNGGGNGGENGGENGAKPAPNSNLDDVAGGNSQKNAAEFADGAGGKSGGDFAGAARKNAADVGVRIIAQIITDTPSHKAMLIGRDAQTIKRIGIKARKLIAALLGQKVALKCEVIVRKNWATNEQVIKKEFGYE